MSKFFLTTKHQFFIHYYYILVRQRQRSTKIHRRQYEFFTAALEQNESLRYGCGDPAKLLELWTDLSDQLNAIGVGPTKSPTEWRKSFVSWKAQTRHKAAHLCNDERTLSDLEVRMLKAYGCKAPDSNENEQKPLLYRSANHYKRTEAGPANTRTLSVLERQRLRPYKHEESVNGIGDSLGCLISEIKECNPLSDDDDKYEEIELLEEMPDEQPNTSSPALSPENDPLTTTSASLAKRRRRAPTKPLPAEYHHPDPPKPHQPSQQAELTAFERAQLLAQRQSDKLRTDALNRMADKLGDLAGSVRSLIASNKEEMASLQSMVANVLEQNTELIRVTLNQPFSDQ